MSHTITHIKKKKSETKVGRGGGYRLNAERGANYREKKEHSLKSCVIFDSPRPKGLVLP